MRCQSQVYGVTDTSHLEEALEAFPFPRPQATYDLAPGPTVVTLSYEVPLPNLNPESAYEPCLLLGSATAAVTYGLWDWLSPFELARLTALGITDKDQLYSDPPTLLSAAPIQHLEWDAQSAPSDTAAAAPSAPLPVGVAGVIPGPLGQEWEGHVKEICETIAEFTTSMLIDVQRTGRGDEIYVQLQRESSGLFAEAVSNTYLQGSSRLNEEDIARLGRLGWSAPTGADHPNFHRWYDLDNVQTVARHVAQTLRDVYHVDPDKDGWLLSFTEPPDAQEELRTVAGTPTALEVVAAPTEEPVQAISERSPQQRLIDWLGAEPTHSRDDGTVFFRLGDLTGGVRQTGPGAVRAWFLIAQNVDSGRASRWITRNKRIGKARLGSGGRQDAKSIFLICEASVDHLDTRDGFSSETATSLQAAWNTRGRGAMRLMRRLSTTGIAVPPLGSVSEREIDSYGEWHWGSRFVDPFDLYMFDIQQVGDLLASRGRFFALSHAGHGMNSYGLNLVVSAGPVATFVQHGWGGVYTDPISAATAIDATYVRLHVLMREAARHDEDNLRWLLVLSEFRGVCGMIDLRGHQPGESLEDKISPFDSESALFRAMAGKFPSASHGIANDDVAW